MLNFGEQLELQLDWGLEPWRGFSPRSLAKIEVEKRVLSRAKMMGTCVVDNSDVGCQSREADRCAANPAQYTAFVRTSF